MTTNELKDEAERAALRLLADMKRTGADVGFLLKRARMQFAALEHEANKAREAVRQ